MVGREETWGFSPRCQHPLLSLLLNSLLLQRVADLLPIALIWLFDSHIQGSGWPRHAHRRGSILSQVPEEWVYKPDHWRVSWLLTCRFPSPSWLPEPECLCRQPQPCLALASSLLVLPILFPAGLSVTFMVHSRAGILALSWSEWITFSDLQNEGDKTHHTNEGGLTLDTCKLSGVMKLAKMKHLDDALYWHYKGVTVRVSRS